jgi:hypothetical protein
LKPLNPAEQLRRYAKNYRNYQLSLTWQKKVPQQSAHDQKLPSAANLCPWFKNKHCLIASKSATAHQKTVTDELNLSTTGRKP